MLNLLSLLSIMTMMRSLRVMPPQMPAAIPIQMIRLSWTSMTRRTMRMAKSCTYSIGRQGGHGIGFKENHDAIGLGSTDMDQGPLSKDGRASTSTDARLHQDDTTIGSQPLPKCTIMKMMRWNHHRVLLMLLGAVGNKETQSGRTARNCVAASATLPII